MRSEVRVSLLTSTAIVSLLYAGGAFAQDESKPKSRSDTVTAIEEIVVTAQRRSENIKDIPISVTAFSQEAMDKQGVRNVNDIARLTPGVTFNKFGNLGSSISIRGISSSAGAPTVGVYIDDTPIQTRATIASGNFSSNSYPQIFDLERVEVLRGPQGTLFGASSQGGTVRFINRTPSLNDYSSYGRTEVASTRGGAESFELGAAVGGPIVQDKVGFRVSAWYRKDGGFVDHVDSVTGRVVNKNADEQRTFNARVALKFQASENLAITPSIFYQRTALDDTHSTWLPVNDVGPGKSGFVFQHTNPDKDVYGQAQPLAQPYYQNFVLPALKVEYDFGAVSLVSSTSYFRRNEHGINDFTAFEVPLWTTIFTGKTTVLPSNANDVATGFDLQRNKFFTQEVRLQSNAPGAALKWTAGVFYSRDKVQTFRSVQNTFLGGILSQAFGGSCAPAQCITAAFGVPLDQGRFLFVGNTTTYDKQLAGFGQADYALTPSLKITAGVRVSKTKFSFTNYAAGPVNGPPSPRTDVGDSSETPVTGKIGISYQKDGGDLYYASIADGFRIGGANVPVNNAGCQAGLAALGLTKVPERYTSDRVRSYEAGSKLAFADGRLRVDGSVFMINWKNRISNIAVPNGCPLSYTDNLGDSTSYGFNLGVDFVPVDNLVLGLQIGDAKSTFDSNFSPSKTQTKPTVSKGDALDGSRFTATLSAQYEFAVMGDSKAYVRGDWTYTGKNDRTPDLNPANASYDVENTATPALSTVNLRAGVYVGPAEVSLFANNVLNENYIVDIGAIGLGSPIHPGFITFRPRTVGLTASYRY